MWVRTSKWEDDTVPVAMVERRRLLAVLAIAACTTIVSVGGLASGTFGGFQAQAEDLLQPGTTDLEDVVVVGIDRKTLDRIGDSWPWTRERHAELLDAVAAGGAKLVIYDVLLADEREGDEAMADALRRTPTVLGSALSLRPGDGGPPTIIERTDPAGMLGNAAAAIGHTNVSVSPGRGIIRSLPLVALDRRGVMVPSIVLAAVARLDGGSDALVERPGGVQVGDRFIPLDDGELRINWSDDLDASSVVSAIDVLDGTVAPGAFRGRTVIVGVSEPTLGDLHLAAVDRSGNMPGSMVLANALNTVLGSSYLRPASAPREQALVVAAAVIVCAAFGLRKLRWGVAAALLIIAAVVAFTTWRFHEAGELWNVVWPTLAALLAAVASTGWRYVAERRSRLVALELVGQFVPTPVARQLLARHGGSLPEGELTFVMTDIVGSTASWEAYPELMRAAIARHDEIVERAIDGHDGALVRPRGEGDSRFAVFVSGQQAVEAALALRDALDHESWSTPEPIRVRIGLNAGEAELRQHDYYGTAVNRCARIRSLAEPGQVLAAAAVVDRLTASVTARDLGMRELKDIPDATRVFELAWAHDASHARLTPTS